MAEGNRKSGGEGLSLQTLVIAAIASGIAAVVVSHLWSGGTVLAAAMTPVIVTIVKELLTRPMESEMVRKPVAQVGRIASERLSVPARRGPRGTVVKPPPPPPPHTDGAYSDGAQFTPIRTYGKPSRRRVHLKLALVTGLLAFVIAVAALTLPELIFGGAVSSGNSTTFFGGGSSSTNKSKSNNNGTTTQPQQSTPTPAITTPHGTTSPPPTRQPNPASTTPAPTTPQRSPQQTTPGRTSPSPATPTTPIP